MRWDPSVIRAISLIRFGEVAEWLMAPVLKTGIPERVSGVRIPSSPPSLTSVALLSVRGHDRVFGIARHAELGDVETFLFHFRRYSHALRLIDDPEDSVGCTERPDGIESCSHELAEELTRIAMEQTGH